MSEESKIRESENGKVFEREVLPLLQQIGNICAKHEMQFAAGVVVGEISPGKVACAAIHMTSKIDDLPEHMAMAMRLLEQPELMEEIKADSAAARQLMPVSTIFH